MNDDTKKVSEIHQPNNLERKRARIYQERRQRKINEGVPEDAVDKVLSRENYERLPVDEKIKHLEHFIAGGLNHLAQEISNLRFNDEVLAEAMDMNFKAISKMLISKGMTIEEQQVFMAEAVKEVAELREARRATKAAEAQRVAKAQETVSETRGIDEPGEPAAPPPEATSFGD